MTTSAQSVVKEVQTELSDLAGIRWSAKDIVEFMNDAQIDVVSLRPDMCAKTISVALVEGARQVVPDDCSKLIEVVRNTSGMAIRQVDKNLIDAGDPYWYSMTKTALIVHFMTDARDPNVYYVYPPAKVGASVEMLYASFPANIPAPGGNSYTTVTGNISVNDIFKNALVHYCLFRCFSRDAEFGGNEQLAAAHYQLFKTALTDDVQTRQAVKPTVANAT